MRSHVVTVSANAWRMESSSIKKSVQWMVPNLSSKFLNMLHYAVLLTISIKESIFIHFIKRHLVCRKLEYLLREIVFCNQCCTGGINQPLQELCRKTLDIIKKDVDHMNWRSQSDDDDLYYWTGHEQRDEW